jgi:hypothetical protein
MAEKVDTSSVLTDVSGRSENRVPENDVKFEPKWYRDGDAWVKLFLEPVEPGKFKQHDYIYNVPGKNEFPKEKWSSVECRDGFHITRRRDVWAHLDLHAYKSAYIAEVVSMGEELYDNLRDKKRKVRVVAFGPAVPLADVLGKHPDDFEYGGTLLWSVTNNHLNLVKLAISNNPRQYAYGLAIHLALVNGNEQVADVLIENCEVEEIRQHMLNYAISHGRVDFVKRLMENTSVIAMFFKTACEDSQFEIFQLLCAKYGDPKCSDIIIGALWGGSADILNYLKSRGIDMSDFGMFVHACVHAPLQTVKYLVSEGADIKHPLIVYIAKRHACDDDDDDGDGDGDDDDDAAVRKYLLAHIDDKSEVSWCKELDRKINKIRKKFLKRIEAGELDGE